MFKVISLLVSLSLVTLGSSAFSADWIRKFQGQMDYYLYMPSNESDPRPHPLMLSLHGCGQNALTLQQFGNWETTAQKYNMIVVLPQVPNGGVYLGCWDYYGRNHSEDNRNNKELIGLIKSLLLEQKLNIDPQQIYISGISSGAGEALVLACLRPDLIAGIGLSSAPSLGSEATELQQAVGKPQELEKLCLQLSKKTVSAFAHQKVAIITGDQDLVVNPSHSALNLEFLKRIYSSPSEISLDPKILPGTRTTGLYSIFLDDKNTVRIAMITNFGLGHNWPAGQGGYGNPPYVSLDSVNFPSFLGQFLFEKLR